jgi:hypothetical protein
MEMSGQLHASAALPSVPNGWMGPRDGLNVGGGEERDSLPLLGIEVSTVTEVLSHGRLFL